MYLKLKQYQIFCLVVGILILLSYGVYLFQLKSVASHTLLQWETQERLSLQQNKILEATANLNRWAKFSGIITGIVLTNSHQEILYRDGADFNSTLTNQSQFDFPFAIITKKSFPNRDLFLAIRVLPEEYLFLHVTYTFIAMLIFFLAFYAIIIVRRNERRKSVDIFEHSVRQLLQDENEVNNVKVPAEFNAIWHKLMENHHNSQLEKILAQKNAAIAQTTQMLAHDVRKPFSMIQSLLDILGSVSDIDQVKELVTSFAPEVRQALQSVNGMIADVMEVGADVVPVTEQVDVTTLIETAIREVFRYNDSAKINFTYDLKHTHQLQINSLKVLRVFANILGNAAQAMSKQGSIWIRTREILINSEPMIEICLGNSGSYIAQEDLGSLFDAFFTKNKKGGTGLGLAIAKKIVTSHGGQIRCDSSKNTGVEFYFTLPIAKGSNAISNQVLPQSSHEVYLANIQVEKKFPIVSEIGSKLAIESQLIELLTSLNTKLRVTIVDDESIYSHLITNFVAEIPALARLVIIDVFEVASKAEQSILVNNPDLVFMDVDLNDDINGFELSAKIRQKGFKNKICIHSNRGSFEFGQQYLESKADLMIPKPMAKAQFLSLLMSIAKNFKMEIPTNINVAEQHESYIIVLDDSKIATMTWQLLVEDFPLKTYDSPEQFFEELDANPKFVNQIRCIVTDNNFSTMNSSFSGFDFVKILRDKGLRFPIFLCSGSDFHPSEMQGLFDATLPSDVKDACALLRSKLALN